MRLSVLTPSFLRAAGLAAALALPASRAAGQAADPMREFASYSSVSDYGSGAAGCEIVWGTGAFARQCTVGNFSGSTSGWVSRTGELHAGARLETWNSSADGQGTAVVEYGDQLQVVGGAMPSFLRFNLFLHGGLRGAQSEAELFLSGSVHQGQEWEGSAAAIRMRGADYPVGTYHVERQSVLVPVISGMASFGLALRVDAVFNGEPCTQEGGHCYTLPGQGVLYTYADFANTAGMESIEALDADRNAISGYKLRSQQGNVYALSGGTMDGAPTVTTTPEPASLALVGTGAMVLVGVTARRRRTR